MKTLNVVKAKEVLFRNSKPLALAVLSIAATSFIYTGCSGSSSSGTAAQPLANKNAAVVAQASSIQNAIYGNYSGSLAQTDPSGTATESQPYTMVLAAGPMAANKAPFLSMTVDSNGTAFPNVKFESVLNYVGSTPQANGETKYQFQSTSGDIPNLSNTPIQLELDLYLTGANQVDPSQSQILIWDCGLGATCDTSNPYEGAAFVGMAKH